MFYSIQLYMYKKSLWEGYSCSLAFLAYITIQNLGYVFVIHPTTY